MLRKSIIAVIFINLIFIVNKLNAQEKKVAVTYKVVMDTANTKKVDAKFDKMFNNIREQLNNLEFLLICDSNKSIYKQSNKLETGENVSYKMASVLGGGNGIYFKDIEKKLKLKQTQSLGKKINVIYDFDEYDWEITKETKEINGYTCYKATAEIREYNKVKGAETIYTPVVWFTPDIALPFGPKGFDGLPGLVIEAQVTNKITIYISKIDFDYDASNKNIIERPKGGKDMTKEEYLNIMN